MSTVGRPLKIISRDKETHNFHLDERALASVLLHDDVKDKPVCVVAVAGGPRKGKSFLLNYLLRYCANPQDNGNWLGDRSSPLKGFRWEKNSSQITTGIDIWSEPFIVRQSNGEEVAILLMDTEGTFDNQASEKESIVLFALSLLTSSVLVYNLKENIHKDDFMHLETFMQYGRIAAAGERDESKAFQKLVFLVRDWYYPKEFGFGLEGGQQFFNTITKNASRPNAAPQDICRKLSDCFSDVSCYLMPYPGPAAQREDLFDGRQSQLTQEFVEHLKILAPLLLAPRNIEKKVIAGETVRAEDLFKCFKLFFAVFTSKDLPEFTSAADSATRAFCEAGIREAKELYRSGMTEIVQSKRVLNSDELETGHWRMRERALEHFSKRNRKMNESIFYSCQEDLKKDLSSAFDYYKKKNEEKYARKEAEDESKKYEKESNENTTWMKIFEFVTILLNTVVPIILRAYFKN